MKARTVLLAGLLGLSGTAVAGEFDDAMTACEPATRRRRKSSPSCTRSARGANALLLVSGIALLGSAI